MTAITEALDARDAEITRLEAENASLRWEREAFRKLAADAQKTVERLSEQLLKQHQANGTSNKIYVVNGRRGNA